MYVALLADIHANLPAFDAVLNDMAQYSPDLIVIAGDLLGYYPDADHVVCKIRTLKRPLYLVAGNHDIPIIKGSIPKDHTCAHILQHNLDHLSAQSHSFLQTLKVAIGFSIDRLTFRVFHGTPDDPLNGRLYPDTKFHANLLLSESDITILGHTHHPCVWGNPRTGMIINPGSVGQPRDGNPAPSWALLNTETLALSFKRVDYDRIVYSKRLNDLNWDRRAIKALFKSKQGKLNAW